jgi:hypothetical protein
VLGPDSRSLLIDPLTLEPSPELRDAVESRRIRQDLYFRHGAYEIFSVYAPIAASTGETRRVIYSPTDGALVAARSERPDRRPGIDDQPVWRAVVEAVIDPDDELMLHLQPDAWNAGRTLDWARSVDHRTLGRVRQLSLDVLADAGVPSMPATESERWTWNLRAAGALSRHLSTDPYRYTLDLSDLVLDGDDPVETFLFESQRGHCEYFASALAAMCHSIGVEARLVAGFAVNEYDAQAQRHIVRAADAHAWVEVRAGDSLARAIDPTPAAVHRARAERAADFADRLSRYYDRVEGAWMRRFLSFSAATQATMASRAEERWSGELETARNRTRAWLEALNRAFYFGPAGTIWLGLVSLAILLVLAEIIRRVRRRRLLRRLLRLEESSADPDLRTMIRRLGFYADMLIVLRRHGRAKPDWMPPLQFARELVEQEPAVGAQVDRLTRTYYAARFGRSSFSKDDHAVAQREVESLEQTLRDRAAEAVTSHLVPEVRTPSQPSE